MPCFFLFPGFTQRLTCSNPAISALCLPLTCFEEGAGLLQAQEILLYSLHNVESFLMETDTMKRSVLLSALFYGGLLASSASNAETTTTTTTTTNPDGTSTTTVEETTTTDEASSSRGTDRNLVGPAGVTGTIRRSDRRQDYRQEQDLEDLKDAGDAINRRPRR